MGKLAPTGEVALRRVIEEMGWIPEDLKRNRPTLHFCREWDGMLIDKDNPEFEACLCPGMKDAAESGGGGDPG